MSLEARKLSFYYQREGKPVLNRVSIQIKGGERVGLSAPSGYGKTTLCKLLAGYEKPGSGAVLLDGEPLEAIRGYCPVQMIWQHPEQVLNPRVRMAESLAEADGIGSEILEGLGIQRDWLRRFPGELSGGELQRFCIARALGRRTRYLLADEISTMLDLITQSQIWGFLLEETRRRGIGLLVVSHSAPLLEHICTRQLAL